MMEWRLVRVLELTRRRQAFELSGGACWRLIENGALHTVKYGMRQADVR